MQIRADFPRTVRTVEHAWIPMSDGCRLAARIWLPEDAERDPVPAILDAVPYRKGDGTAAGDAAWNRYFAGHGYAGVRIDLRGSGDADGLIADEYSEQEARDVDQAIALGLVPVAVDTWGPFVFVNPDAGAAPLAEALGDLPAVVAAHGTDVNALRFHHRVEFEIRANWKIALENYLECYHCQLNHPGLVSVIDDRRLVLEARGLRASQFNPAHPDFDVAGGNDQGQFHLLFPSMKLNVQPGPANLSIGPVWPVAPDHCRGFLDYFFAPDAPGEWIAEFLAFDDQVGAEDTALVEAAKAGAGSGLVPDGRLLAHDEQLIAHFQAYVRETLN